MFNSKVFSAKNTLWPFEEIKMNEYSCPTKSSKKKKKLVLGN
jgi:hypothetical protein